MSDLAATNCQTTCNGGCGWSNGNGCGGSSIIWILLLLCCCGNGSVFGGNDGCNSCDSLIWILLLLCFCGNGNSSSCLGCGC